MGACSQLVRGCRLWGRDCSSPSDSGCHPPASVPPAGDEPVHSQLALLWYSLIPLFCERTWQCLRLELFAGKFFLSLFSLSLAIPQFWLLSHVSSLRLSSRHSGPVVPLSSVVHASLFSPHLLVEDMSIWATSPLGVAVRHLICGLICVIFFFFSSRLCCPLRFQNS